jgi:thymidylate synthase
MKVNIKNKAMGNIIDMQLGTLLAETNFSESYLDLHNNISNYGEVQDSRNGSTIEVLNFKTILNNPNYRCVGGNNRNVNIFFLIAEAIWIWCGKSDVAFLNIFNSQMKQFSDDGEVFHAPYGFRLRSYNLTSNDYSNECIDQLKESIIMLENNSVDRRVVCSIWNPNLDLNKVSKDLPCNDMLMFKIRKGKLHSTIQNRSNDLHLGLPTNIFQFSFIGNIIANILGVEVGTQVHNSQSLHIYNDGAFNSVANKLNDDSNLNKCRLYEIAKPFEIDFGFEQNMMTATEKLDLVDYYFNNVIQKINQLNNGESPKPIFIKEDIKFLYELLSIYVSFKNDKDEYRYFEAIARLLKMDFRNEKYLQSDLYLLSLNFIYNLAKLKPNFNEVVYAINNSKLPTEFKNAIGKL